MPLEAPETTASLSIFVITPSAPDGRASHRYASKSTPAQRRSDVDAGLEAREARACLDDDTRSVWKRASGPRLTARRGAAAPSGRRSR
jgi:hypothetical protein